MGQFISVIPLTVLSLAVSILEALIILPVHASEIMKTRAKKKTSIFTLIEPVQVFELVYSQSLVDADHFYRHFWRQYGTNGQSVLKVHTFPATGLTGLNIRWR